MIETRFFAITPGKYVRTAIAIWLMRYGWMGVVIISGFVAAGFLDPRFFIVAAAITLIAYPGVMMIVYFNHALTKEAAYCVVPHKVKFDDTFISIEYQIQEDRPTPPIRTIRMDEIENAEDTGSSLKISLKGKKYDFIDIPAEAFEGDNFNEVLEAIKRKTPNATISIS